MYLTKRDEGAWFESNARRAGQSELESTRYCLFGSHAGLASIFDVNPAKDCHRFYDGLGIRKEQVPSVRASLQPPQPILPPRPGSGLRAGTAQLKSGSDGLPQPILPARLGARSAVGQPHGVPQPILPARATSTGRAVRGRTGVVQGAFPSGRPRVPARAPRPGQNQNGTFQLKPALPIGNATLLPDDFAGLRSFSPGKRMPQAIQAKMESLFRTSFGDVRIHEGPEASSIGALAFTQGSSIFFAHGQYNPNTPQGQRLLGQQLAHVVQQRSGRVRNPFGAGLAVVQDPLLKAEAEMMGSRAAMAQAIQPKNQANGRNPAANARHQAPAPILPKRVGAANASATASAASGGILRSTPSATRPDLAEEGRWRMSESPSTSSNSPHGTNSSEQASSSEAGRCADLAGPSRFHSRRGRTGRAADLGPRGGCRPWPRTLQLRCHPCRTQGVWSLIHRAWSSAGPSMTGP